MITWAEFAAARPELAESARSLFYQFGVGLGFLATVRIDGRPRVHPMCPMVTESGLYAFIVPSPKLNDLRRDGHFAMHSFPRPQDEDAFSCTGRAVEVHEAAAREPLVAQFLAERNWTEAPLPMAEQVTFELLLDGCLLTRTTGHGDPAPQHTVWHAP